MKKFFEDFKKFIKRGNILDMAVGVIIGSAFSAIVTAFTNKIIMPFVNYILSLCGGDKGLTSAYTFLKTVTDETGAIDLTKSIYIDWGAFITAILNFLIIAFTLFMIVKIAMKSREILDKTQSSINKNKLTKAEKKELKKLGISKMDRKAVSEFKAQKAKEAEEKKKADEEAAKAKAAAERLANPTTEDLLKQILEIMKGPSTEINEAESKETTENVEAE